MNAPVNASSGDRPEETVSRQIIVVVGDPFEVPRQTDNRQADDKQPETLNW